MATYSDSHHDYDHDYDLDHTYSRPPAGTRRSKRLRSASAFAVCATSTLTHYTPVSSKPATSTRPLRAHHHRRSKRLRSVCPTRVEGRLGERGGAWGGKKNDEEDGANRTPPFSRPSSDTILLVDNELPKRATSDIPEESETRTRQRKRKRKRKQDREPSKESKRESEELDVHAGTHKEEPEQGQQPAHGQLAPTLDDSTSLATTDVSPLTTFTPCEPTDVISINIFEEGVGECLAEAFATSRRWEEARIFKYGNEVGTTWKRGSTPEEARTAWTRKMDEQQRAWDILSESDDSRG
ncbi:hypothetical protein LTR74_017127 [Friedmanniomyces endolithicus]|nr:hypothetical protein LTR74_017127 [Friedmanniomyces endolithicus]